MYFLETQDTFLLILIRRSLGAFGISKGVLRLTTKTDPEVTKLFMLNTAEHEMFPADESQITNNCKFFLSKFS